jgi:hypothetical protein
MRAKITLKKRNKDGRIANNEKHKHMTNTQNVFKTSKDKTESKSLRHH